MYSTCLFCNGHLGTNDVVEPFPVGRRLAFDATRGRLWVVCTHCRRWNLTPLEERWEAIDECERRFRDTHLRLSTDNIGYAQLLEGLELVRIGRALRPEIAAWRYGNELARRRPRAMRANAGELLREGVRAANRGLSTVLRAAIPDLLIDDPLTRLRLYTHRQRVLDVAADENGRRAVIRYGHVDEAELVRPDPEEPWRLLVRHDGGIATLSRESGLRTAAKLLATINAYGGSTSEVHYAMSKVEDAEDADGYFARVVALAMRTSWGRHPDAVGSAHASAPASTAERLALHITSRSFWGRGAIGSEPRTPLLRLPLVDRLALEMAANEDTERRAMAGELSELEAAWREAEEIAAISDGMFADSELAEFKRQLVERALLRS